MQLFIIDPPNIVGGSICLQDAALLHQMIRVLRMHVGSQCAVQRYEDMVVHRATISIDLIEKDRIEATLMSTTAVDLPDFPQTRIAVARPNKSDKLERVVQKLTEIGLHEIIFFKAERSQPGIWNEKKQTRVAKIIKEATEQSRGWTMPSINYYTALADIADVEEYIIADIPGRFPDAVTHHPDATMSPVPVSGEPTKKLYCIGPEGGRGPRDYAFFHENHTTVMGLGDRVLRMETAAIVVGWEIQNHINNTSC